MTSQSNSQVLAAPDKRARVRPILHSRVLWVCVIVALALVTMSAIGAQRIVTAARQLADGEGELLLARVADAIHSNSGPLTSAHLDAIVDDNAKRGLVSIEVEMHRPGSERVASKTARKHSPQKISRLLPPPPDGGDRNRFRPPPGGPHGDRPPPRVPQGFPHSEALDDSAPPRGPGPEMPTPPLVTIGFTGIAAAGAQQQATVQLVFALLAACFLVLLGVAFARSDRRRDRLQMALGEQQMLASLGEMSAVLAHEIRNPLGAIKGHAQLLVEDLDDRAEDQKRAERLVREAVRLESIVADLLTFVRSGELTRTPTPLLPVMNDAIARAGAAPVTLSSSIDATFAIPIDAARLGLAVGNILDNAVAAGTGAVSVTISEASLSTQTSSKKRAAVSIMIEDDGPGIPNAIKDRVFDPFVTTKTKGTGLGLALSARIIGAHGGTLALATPTKLGGAAFEILLPHDDTQTSTQTKVDS